MATDKLSFPPCTLKNYKLIITITLVLLVAFGGLIQLSAVLRDSSRKIQRSVNFVKYAALEINRVKAERSSDLSTRSDEIFMCLR